ncbi:diacylglycerol kinase family lipid kinase [Mucilaginibacter sp. RS28]|uniref:Diacylglycerol kinase family lipid kinase n=1 Tax=Mucilaginibacter straminoryzae TaxID=2932774 RepID=A0A9X2BDW7_9SPHI|nr:diacylglycerol kinase family protein [Mucilaginibacter straminoryzae]MCJ8210783.1 diacylglycerol kinase family lipid kinase [Mucilaginibacter straminoryzae]
MKKKALFIINPISGGKTKDKVPELIKRFLDPEIFTYHIEFTRAHGQAHELASKAVGVYDLVVAVGGDGTVNEIASALAGTAAVFAILPYGSGNGLSRFLSIPMDTAEAIRTLNHYYVEVIDGARINGQWFFNMAGMGFDAHISEVFSHQKSRGFITYFKSSVKEITTYKSQRYQLNIDGKHYDREAFMLSFANSSQFGNNAHVAPHASVQDGLLDVCVIKPFPLYRFPEMGLRMFNKTADKSDYVEIIKGRHIEVKRQQAGPVHLDGEPQLLGPDAEIEVVPRILKVIVGKQYKENNNGEK